MSLLKQTRNVFPSKFKDIDRLEARIGFVYVHMKDGRIHTFTPEDAAKRFLVVAAALQKSADKADHDMLRDMYPRFEAVCTEARHQLESPGDRVTQMVANVMGGKRPDGTPIPAMTPEQIKLIEQWRLQYPTVNLHEMTVVLRSNYADSIKEGMVREINRERIRTRNFTAPL